LMQFQELKSQMSRLRNTEHQRLVKLTMLCDSALKDLKSKRAKVQHYHSLSTSFYSPSRQCHIKQVG